MAGRTAEDTDELRARVGELVAANARLGLLVGATPVGLVAIDADGVFTEAIGGALVELRLPPESLVGKSVFELFADEPDVIDQARRALAGEHLVSELTIGEHDVLMTYQPIVEGGVVTGAVGIGTIVTAERRSTRQAEALAELSRSTIEAGSDLLAVLAAVTSTMCDVLGRAALVGLVSADGKRAELLSGRDNDPIAHAALQEMRGIGVDIAGRGLWARAINERAALVVSLATPAEVAEHVDEGVAQLVRETGITSCIVLPMIAAGRVIGTLTTGRSPDERAFDAGDVELATMIAERAAIAIDHARLFAALQQRAAQQAAVAELGATALRQGEVRDLVHPAVELLADRLGVEGAAIALDDGHPKGPAVVAASGHLSSYVGQRRWPPGGGSIVAQLVESGQPVVISDVATDPRILPSDTVLLQHRSAMAVRIEGRDQSYGFVAVLSKVPRDFTPDDVNFLMATANVLGTAADAARSAYELRHNALHDTLTGLPNRTLLADRLTRALELADRRSARVAVLVCDLDRFKVINDSLGHPSGDHVLIEAAQRLTSAVRAGDTVARFGGDEMVVVADVQGVADVLHLASRIVDAFQHPFRVADGECFATISVGIALSQGDDATPDTLLRDADMALYRAKELGRSRFELFDDGLRARADERLRIETALRQGIARGELHLVYQPVFAVKTGVMLGVEALVRWEHPEMGRLGPATFLPVAEEAGLMGDIGAWVVGEAASQTARWAAGSAWGERWTALNLAPHQVADPDLPRWFTAAVRAAGVDPSRMRIEVTEEAFLEDTALVTANLTELRSLGVGVSIDDFGTGYSSLGYLKRLPIDAIKIDRAFVIGIESNDSDRAIVEALVRLSHALGLTVVAEGVEDEQQLVELARLGCDAAQGFHLARPLEADRVLDLITGRARSQRR